MDYTVHGIHQARILEWVAYPLSRGIPKQHIFLLFCEKNKGKTINRIYSIFLHMETLKGYKRFLFLCLDSPKPIISRTHLHRLFITITCPPLNQSVPQVDDSFHLLSSAIDLIFKGLVLQIFSLKGKQNLNYHLI